MNLGMYEAATESIESENWEALWGDSYLWNGKDVRDLLYYDEGEVYPDEGVTSSLLQTVLDRIFSGV